MKRVINTTKVLLALGALAAVAHAGCEFPYYPEYADLFSQYDEVTPAMAKAAAIKEAKEFAAEPVLLRDVTGMPYCYVVTVYENYDAVKVKRIEKWDKVIKSINAGDKIDAGELSRFFANYYFGFYDTASRIHLTGAYTFEETRIGISGRKGVILLPALVPCFAGYIAAYSEAMLHFGYVPFYFTRVITFGTNAVQIFEFENEQGEKLSVLANERGGARTADLEENAGYMRNLALEKSEWVKNNPESARANHAKWQKLAAGLE